jgi:hypothetical protein
MQVEAGTFSKQPLVRHRIPDRADAASRQAANHLIQSSTLVVYQECLHRSPDRGETGNARIVGG